MVPENTYSSNGSCKICAAEKSREYRAANRDARKAQQAEYRAANRPAIRARNVLKYKEDGAKIRAWQAANYQANREVILGRNAKYRAENQDAISAQKAAYRERLRRDALDHYGHRCACCGIDTSDVFLSLDHISGGGADHRRALGMNGGAQFHKWLRENNFPADFQTLCWSCNGAKSKRTHCPHVLPTVPKNANQRYRRRLKIETLEAYGGSCACCGEAGVDFLHLDHVDGNGKAHRRSLAKNPGGFYATLRKLGFPNDPPLRVLCGNCNNAVRFGVCPHQTLNGGTR
jgi:hypothetical protein